MIADVASLKRGEGIDGEEFFAALERERHQSQDQRGSRQLTFYNAVRRFLTDEWGQSCVGPWWEGGLQMEFGCSLIRSLAGASVVSRK
jgi:hypothetical protein